MCTTLYNVYIYMWDMTCYQKKLMVIKKKKKKEIAVPLRLKVCITLIGKVLATSLTHTL